MNKTIARGLSIVAAAGVFAIAATGVASAADHRGGGVDAPAAHVTQVAPKAMYSLGIKLFNGTTYDYKLTGVMGDNEGVPTLGSPLVPNVGYQDFEVTWKFAAVNEVVATYDILDPRWGTKLGTAIIGMSVDAADNPHVAGTYVLDADGTTRPLNISGADTQNAQILP